MLSCLASGVAVEKSEAILIPDLVTCFLSLETRRCPHLPFDVIKLGAQVEISDCVSLWGTFLELLH